MTTMYTAKNYDRALLCPASVFDRPMRIVVTSSLTSPQKLEVLKRWEAEERHLDLATEENMAGGEPSRLGDVRSAIDLLCASEASMKNAASPIPDLRRSATRRTRSPVSAEHR